MTIEEYIKSKNKFRLIPFTTIYVTITELIDDGFIESSAFEKAGGSNVAVCEQKPTEQECRRLHGSGDFHSNR